MDEARTENLRNQGKDRWEKCKRIAEHLGTTKEIVYNKLWSFMRANNYVDRALDGDSEILRELKEKLREQPRIYESRQDKDDIITVPADQIRTAMWFIKKMGSPEMALKVINAAIAATRELEKPDE